MAIGLVFLCVVALPGIAHGGQQKPLISSPGENAVIPGWYLQSTTKVNESLSDLSQSTFDSSSWYSTDSRSTVMAGLIEAGVYNVNNLWYSDNLQTTIDYAGFTVPWLYRQVFSLQPDPGKHFFLSTNGITSKADIFLNGNEVASHYIQAGAYGGLTFDITKFVRHENALTIKAYPTNYNKDFALGFVDWNPYPPDNGTGIWRNVMVKETGPVAIGIPRVLTDFTAPEVKSVTVTLKTDVQNLENMPMFGTVHGTVEGGDGTSLATSVPFDLEALTTKTIAMNMTVNNPQIWWPKQWGDQPLYSTQMTVHANGSLSDVSDANNFGIRHITSTLNEHNDTMFVVNGQPFQVLGGGYGPDMFLRWDSNRFETIAQYVLSMGMNTIRLEGKMEQPELYEIADKLGLMILPGLECCDKWEAWKYNDEIIPVYWDANDYQTANKSIRHEASYMQHHPSILGFLIGSDYWPDDRAAEIYVEALRELDWQNPIICSAAKRGYPKILGPSGMKNERPV